MVSGDGLGDVGGSIQLGWQQGTFFHTVYVQGVAPTGRFVKGFEPNVGLNRPAVDVGWGFTWVEPTSKFQFNGVVGFTLSEENNITNYKSGNDFHMEWAIGRDLAPGLTLGVAGYSFRQLNGDSGVGATLGPLKGSAGAVGPALLYSTMVGKTPLTIAARYYHEYHVEKRFRTDAAFLTITTKL